MIKILPGVIKAALDRSLPLVGVGEHQRGDILARKSGLDESAPWVQYKSLTLIFGHDKNKYNYRKIRRLKKGYLNIEVNFNALFLD